jgi:hypothetical protein
MTTSLNVTAPQRDSGYQMVGFLRRSFTFSDFPTGALVKVVGGLPANAQVVAGYIVVTTACVGGTLNVGTLDYDGTTTTPAAFASAMVITALTGPTPFDDILLTTATARTVPTQIIATTSATLTAGAFDVIVLFVPKNPTSGLGA